MYPSFKIFIAVPDSEEFEVIYTGDGAVVGKESVLEVRFHSRPEPRPNVTWYPYDLSIPITNEQSTSGRYTVEPIVEVYEFKTRTVFCLIKLFDLINTLVPIEVYRIRHFEDGY